MNQSHNATGSMLGYLYQSRYALLRGLEEGRTSAGHALTIEKFDDIAFEEGDSPVELIQAKHHGKPGDTSDKSVDVWKTLAIWTERVKGDPVTAADTRFVFLTTNTASPSSALSRLRQTGENRDVDGAVALLIDAAKSSNSMATAKARADFVAMDEGLRKLLVGNIWVLDRAPNIVNVRDDIEALLFYSAPRDHIKTFTDYLEGWWFSRIISALTDPTQASIPLTAIQAKIDDLRESFQTGKLPLDETIEAMPPVSTLPDDDRAFVRQMRLVGLPEPSTLAAVHDYYRAFEQRSRWARENLFLDGEADRYDRALQDAWQRRLAAKKEEYGNCSNADKEKLGRELFHWASSYPKPLRNRDELWLSSGSYQILADSIRVGWHPEFKALMDGGKEAP